MQSDPGAALDSAVRSRSSGLGVQPKGTYESSSGSELPPKYDVQSKPANNIDPVKQTRKVVPHILVSFRGGHVNAWGREGVSKMGYSLFASSLFNAYVSHPSSAPPRRGLLKKNPKRRAFWRKHSQMQQHFCAHAKLLATFATTSGGVDVTEPVRLQAVGWPEMIRNVIEINVLYEPPAESVSQA